MAGVSATMKRSRWRRTSLWVFAGVAAVSFDLGALGQRVRVEDARAIYLAYAGGATAGMHGTPGYLGVNIGEVSESAAGRIPRGAEILHVDHDGPAGKAGLREHDIVLNLNGQPIENGEFLRRLLHETPPGHTVTLVINRGGKQQTVSTQMSTREDVEREAWEQHIAIPDTASAAPAVGEDHADKHGNGFFSAPGRAGRSLLGSMSPAYTGVMLETMAPQLAEFFGSEGKTGLLVRSVDANSPASAAGLRAGDVVVRVNTVGMASNGDWLRVVRDNKGRAISVVVLRDRREQTLTMIPNAKHHSNMLPDFWPFGGNLRSNVAPERASVPAAPAGFVR